MSMMEYLVRPFAPVIISPQLQAPRSVPEVPGIVQCRLGGMGGTSVSISFSGQGEVINNDNKFKESGRTSTNVHVENPDDSDQFVEFCRADKVSFTPVNKDTEKLRQSSYDTNGNINGNGSGSEFSYQYPKTTNCVSPAVPSKGC